MVESYDSRRPEPYQDTPNAPLTGMAASGQTPGSGHGTNAAKNVASTAGQQAAAVRDVAADATSDVVNNAKDEAAVVVEEAKAQGRRLYREGMAELRTQAENGQGKLAELVRSLTDELKTMVAAGDHEGPVSQVAESLQEAGERAASWLESRGPQGAMSDLRRDAARNPIPFLAAAAGVGFVGSRLARSLRDVAAEASEPVGYRPVATDAFDVRPSTYGDATLGSAVTRSEPWPASQTDGDWSGVRPATTPTTTGRPFTDLEDPNR